MRVTMRTNLAMRILMACAVNGDRLMRRAEIARMADSSENHLAQVVHLLGQEGYLTTVRGRAGGLTLARAPEDITVGEIFRKMEGSLPIAACFDVREDACPLKNGCRLRALLSTAVEAFYAELDKVTLADLVQDNDELDAILSYHAVGAERAAPGQFCARP